MKRKILIPLLILILMFAALPLLRVRANGNEKVRVIIQFEKPSYAEYMKTHKTLPLSTLTKNSYIQTLKIEHEKILSSILNEGIYLKKRWDYFLAYSGVGAEVNKEQIENLKRVPGVKNVFIAKTFKPATDLFVPLLKAPEVWKMNDAEGLSVTGKGMKIGIIDTGIDYNHPDLGGPGFPNEKVVGGYDFADDDDDPMDPPSQGHGTAVAGIAAGNGKVRGMAPDALLYAYKVFSNEGGASEDDIIAAVEQALKDGCTAVNLSLGSTGGKSEGTPELDTMNNAVDLGLIVVAAAGNEGIRSKELRWPISAPSSAKKAISVAASDEGGGSVNIVSPSGYEDKFIPFTYGDGVPEFEEGKEYELVECGYGREKDFEGKDLTGKLALIKRGPLYPENALLFETKYFNALSHGAEGVVVYNCAPGPLITMALGIENHPGVELKPAVFIMEEDGKLLKSLLEQGVKTFSRSGNGLKVSFSRKYRPNHLIADFSSQGPTPDGVFKPEISAPGTNTFTTAPEGRYTYGFGGTSGATPFTAGATVLIKQLHPDWTPEDVKTALMNNAFILENPNNNLPFSWTDQGAGRVDVYASATTPLLIKPFDLLLKPEESTLSTKEEGITFEVKNVSDKDVTFSVSSEVLSMVEGITLSYMNKEETFTVKAGETAEVPFSYTIDDKLPDNYYEGIVYFKTDDRTLHIPVVIQKGLPKPPKKVLEDVSINPRKLSPNGDGVDDTMTFHFKLSLGEKGLFHEEAYRSRVTGVIIDILDEKGKTVLKSIYHKVLMTGEYEFVWDGRDIDGNFFLDNGRYQYKIYSVTIQSGDQLKLVEEGAKTGYFTVEGVAFPAAKLTGRDSVPKNTEFTIDVLAKAAVDLKKVLLELDFDPEYLEVEEVTLGDFLKQEDVDVSLTPEIDSENGKLKVTAERQAEKGVSGEGVVLRIRFKALKDGGVKISLTRFTGYDSENRPMNFLLSEKLIKITLLLGDINEDGKVDSSDLIIFAQAFGSQEGDPNWNEKCDLNGDGKIDTEDLLLLAQNFGNVAP